MTDPSSWLIGTSGECDLAVTETIVSGEHCRLTRTAQGYIVEDLDSTNGTYVNGVLITGPTPVSCDDQVTLGQRVAMPWPIEETCGNAVPRVIRIGRDPENDVVIDATMLSSFHAKITVTGNKYVISDLKSTNGTAINKPDNFIREAHLSLVLQLDFLDIGTKCTFSTGIRGGQGCRLIRKLPSGLRKSMRRPG